MISYLDASALVKSYIAEEGSEQLADLIAGSEALATSDLSRVEVVAALAKAVRLQAIPEEAALLARQRFSVEWVDLLRIAVTSALVERAAAMAWQHWLRGYDAVHLAAAATWQEAVGLTVTLATFDLRLAEAARRAGLEVWGA